MYDSIYQTLARCEKETMDKIVAKLKDYDHKFEEIEVDGFTIHCNSNEYEIISKWDEDVYYFKILDTDNKRETLSEF